jgi:hypothetical protein
MEMRHRCESNQTGLRYLARHAFLLILSLVGRLFGLEAFSPRVLFAVNFFFVI